MVPIVRPRLTPRTCRLAVSLLAAPGLSFGQQSPFLTGATALQTNLLAWMTPIAIILIIAQVSATYGSGTAQTLVENCGNTLILRCSGSERGGTSQFASRLIGEREVVRRSRSRTRNESGWCSGRVQRSVQLSEQRTLESAVLAAEIEQLPDLSGFLKTASSPVWYPVQIRR